MRHSASMSLSALNNRHNYTATFDVYYSGYGHYGVSGMSIMTCDGINFDFNNSGHSKFTGIAQGQIPEILFFHWPDRQITIIQSHLVPDITCDICTLFSLTLSAKQTYQTYFCFPLTVQILTSWYL